MGDDDRLTPAEKQVCWRSADRESIRPERRGTFAAGFIAAKRHFTKALAAREDTERQDGEREIPNFRELLMEKNTHPHDEEAWLVQITDLGIVQSSYDNHDFGVVKNGELEKARKERDYAEGLLGWAASLLGSGAWAVRDTEQESSTHLLRVRSDQMGAAIGTLAREGIELLPVNPTDERLLKAVWRAREDLSSISGIVSDPRAVATINAAVDRCSYILRGWTPSA